MWHTHTDTALERVNVFYMKLLPLISINISRMLFLYNKKIVFYLIFWTTIQHYFCIYHTKSDKVPLEVYTYVLYFLEVLSFVPEIKDSHNKNKIQICTKLSEITHFLCWNLHKKDHIAVHHISKIFTVNKRLQDVHFNYWNKLIKL